MASINSIMMGARSSNQDCTCSSIRLWYDAVRLFILQRFPRETFTFWSSLSFAKICKIIYTKLAHISRTQISHRCSKYTQWFWLITHMIKAFSSSCRPVLSQFLLFTSFYAYQQWQNLYTLFDHCNRWIFKPPNMLLISANCGSITSGSAFMILILVCLSILAFFSRSSPLRIRCIFNTFPFRKIRICIIRHHTDIFDNESNCYIQIYLHALLTGGVAVKIVETYETVRTSACN